MSTFTIADLEVAINHCLARQPSETNCLPSDASKLGDVYGSMIWAKQDSRSIETLSVDEQAAFIRWRII
ncbi:DUF3717 domain-containing protein [Paraburkholderia sacchari]|uniref:DUF3717 domain-containing protein n=1 Tax=Paraburkholderia sacchari TaxID=159450 RepID=UPI00054437E9|nr:DUF3717 domain-containing protein [Paraburkholderia sacchari]NLP65556.1 DUF3717 domain-containing protein [Paraburkholderia sacchari]